MRRPSSPVGLRRFAPLFVAIVAPQAVLLAGFLAAGGPGVPRAKVPPPEAPAHRDTVRAEEIASLSGAANAAAPWRPRRQL